MVWCGLKSYPAAQSLSVLSCPVVRAKSLGDVTAHGRVQDWPSRESLGTTLAIRYSLNRACETCAALRCKLFFYYYYLIKMERVVEQICFVNMMYIIYVCAVMQLNNQIQFYCQLGLVFVAYADEVIPMCIFKIF